MSQGQPSQAGQGGTSEPPGGSTPGTPVETEEPSEKPSGEKPEPEAPPEEQPAPPAEEPAPTEEEPEEEKVTICHKAGSSNAKTLTVSADAAAEHLAHGDTLGACP